MHGEWEPHLVLPDPSQADRRSLASKWPSTRPETSLPLPEPPRDPTPTRKPLALRTQDTPEAPEKPSSQKDAAKALNTLTALQPRPAVQLALGRATAATENGLHMPEPRIGARVPWLPVAVGSHGWDEDQAGGHQPQREHNMEPSDGDSEVAIIKMLQKKAITDSPETNEKIENLNKEID